MLRMQSLTLPKTGTQLKVQRAFINTMIVLDLRLSVVPKREREIKIHGIYIDYSLTPVLSCAS
jgi:hypothetical protein